MRKIMSLVAVLVAICLVAGPALSCGPTFDEEGIDRVTVYAEEIIPAVDAALFATAISEDGSEFMQDAQSIRAINARHWTQEFPTYEEMKEWGFKRTMGGTTWDIDGEQLADAVWAVEFGSTWLADALEKTSQAGGDLTGDDAQWVASGLEEARESTDELRWILYRQ